eukprot:TRINITY_DN9599_c0_g1_i15.p1 TRINITY_DN9599_c0_g1~~TRINITY_DN9599_c0_g1_i15.p1  ORF type:complete len:237 (-),score=77.36 TRINITY_DN9599_c0_g1_i15:643-1353(-)
MEKFREYNGLSGLRASKLMIKETKKYIPENGRIGDLVKSFTEISCDLLSDDIWLFVQYVISSNESTENKKHAGVEMKVAKDCSISNLLQVLEKLAMNFWTYINSSNPRHYYLLKSMTSKVVKMPEAESEMILEDAPGEIIDDSLNDDKVETHLSFETALVVHVEVSTLDAELASNSREALKRLSELNLQNSESPKPKLVDLLTGESRSLADSSGFAKYARTRRSCLVIHRRVLLQR